MEGTIDREKSKIYYFKCFECMHKNVVSAEESPYSQKINIDCTSVSTQPAISKMLLYAVHCDASLTYLPIGYFT